MAFYAQSNKKNSKNSIKFSAARQNDELTSRKARGSRH